MTTESWTNGEHPVPSDEILTGWRCQDTLMSKFSDGHETDNPSFCFTSKRPQELCEHNVNMGQALFSEARELYIESCTMFSQHPLNCLNWSFQTRPSLFKGSLMLVCMISDFTQISDACLGALTCVVALSKVWWCYRPWSRASLKLNMCACVHWAVWWRSAWCDGVADM